MKNRIVNILNQAKSFYFATVEGDQPRVRPYNVAVEFEDKVYFYTNNHTHAFKQIAVNPKIELCAPISEERWLRISGKVVYDYRPEVKKAVLDAKYVLANDVVAKKHMMDMDTPKIGEILDDKEKTIKLLSNQCDG